MPENICRRCGTCCRNGGPALHREDLDLLENIPMSDLVCLRRGEPATDPRKSGLHVLPAEMIKFRGKGKGWECVYFSEEAAGCTIYRNRPLECRVLFCEDTTGIFEAMDRAAISRQDLVTPESALWECIVEHERKFPVEPALNLAQAMPAGTRFSAPELDAMLRQEMYFRKSFAEKVGAADSDLWAYFGRPLWMVLVPVNRAFLRYESSSVFLSNC